MKFRLSSEYGVFEEIRNGRAHSGVDLAMPENTPLRTISDGTVTKIIDQGSEGLGKAVYIETNEGTTHIYAHLNDVLVSKGYSIKEGEVIALSGNTGHSTGPHLHFQVIDSSGNVIDPTPLIAKVDAFAGDINNVNIALQSDGGGIGSWALDKYNGFADWFIGKQTEILWKPISNLITEIASNLYNATYLIIPELAGMLTILTGVMLMVPFVKRGKVIGVYCTVLFALITWKAFGG